MQSKETRLMGTEIRLHNLQNNGKNVKSPGVIKKLQRQLRRENMVKGE